MERIIMNYVEVTQEKLLGIIDLRYQDGKLQALFKYEIATFKPLQGGAISAPILTYREEWKTVTENGCRGEYKIT